MERQVKRDVIKPFELNVVAYHRYLEATKDMLKFTRLRMIAKRRNLLPKVHVKES